MIFPEAVSGTSLQVVKSVLRGTVLAGMTKGAFPMFNTLDIARDVEY